VIVTPSVEGAAFVIGAIRAHARRFKLNGAIVPDEVWQIEAALTSGVTQGQAGSSSAASVRTEQVSPMTPMCVTYETAADLLSVSVSTLKRRITAGDLRPVHIGGNARIRVSELNALVAQCSDDTEGRNS